jgi:hypothetical protein
MAAGKAACLRCLCKVLVHEFLPFDGLSIFADPV